MKVLVTGGAGFVGRAIVEMLVRQGDHVGAYQRGLYPDLESKGIRCFRGDLMDENSLQRAIAGCETVFHTAAKVSVWGKYSEFYRTNVIGTKHVIDCCRRSGVAKLVFTSSPSVVFNGVDASGIDNKAPYPSRYLSPYPATKALAERLVLAANSRELATIALRPHLIWGPGDTHIVPQLLARARAGRLWLVGDGKNVIDSTYIDNAAAAHLLAAKRLNPAAPCAGRAYFVTNGEPLPIADLLMRILTAAALTPKIPSISPRVAYVIGGGLEFVYRFLRLTKEPPITRFAVRELATSHFFDISATKRDLGYNPLISIDEGITRLRQACTGQLPARG